MFACTGLLEVASALASAMTFVTCIGLLGVPVSNLGSDIDYPHRIFFCALAHSRHENARIVSYGCEDRGSENFFLIHYSSPFDAILNCRRRISTEKSYVWYLW